MKNIMDPEKEQCINCSNMAVWVYLNFFGFYCDSCVPRGCGCNWFQENIDDPNSNLIEDVDERGRSLPCCEYDYCKEGFDV